MKIEKNFTYIYFYVTLPILLISIFILIFPYRLLSTDISVSTDIAIVEGWMDDYELKAVAEQLRGGDFSKVFTTGVMIEKGKMFYPVGSWAELCEIQLNSMLTEEISIIPIISDAKENRTLSSAKDAFHEIRKHSEITSFMIFTSEIHSRRTFITYKRIFPEKYSIGVYPVGNLVYNKDSYKHSSYGMKKVITELVAFFYHTIFRR
ncbi:MAG: hypothetical protein ACOCWO_04020 [Candidatus Muiribacteriaceae bacterium]